MNKVEEIKTDKLCEYGCGQVAKFRFKSGKLCCSYNHSKCPQIIQKYKIAKKGKKFSDEHKMKLSKAGKCKIISNEQRSKISKKMKENWKDETSIFNTTEYRKKLSDGISGKIVSDKTKLKMSKSFKGRIVSLKTKNKIRKWHLKNKVNFSKDARQKMSHKGQNHGMFGKKHTEEAKNKIAAANIGKLYLTIEKIKKLYPTFSKIEEIRYNPNDSTIRQVHCKNHKCPNSKEKGGWFDVNLVQLESRIWALEKPNGNDGSYFYCCEECKNECPLFNLQSDPNKENELNYTAEEYQTFRNEVLNRANYKCEYCGEKATYVHHSRPQKLEPFYSLDPDFGIACCEKCHYEKGHKDECSTGQLANKVCL